MHIAKPDVVQGFELLADARLVGEQGERILDGEFEHFADREAAEPHLERFTVVALALARLAGHVDVGQEVHFDLDEAVALARFAAPALHVE